MMFEHTFFINLESRVDRLAHVTAELEKLGISGERFNAVRMKNGAIGCTISHIKCLEMAIDRGYKNVFICEDDICFTNPDLFKKNMQKFSDNKDLQWDVCLVAGNNRPPYQPVGNYCAKISNCQTTTGYVVKQHYYKTLIENFKEGLKQLLRFPENKHEFAIDMYWKQLQQVHNWYIITPLTVCQMEGYSDIENQVTDFRYMLLDMDKEWLLKRNALMRMQFL